MKENALKKKKRKDDDEVMYYKQIYKEKGLKGLIDELQ